MYLKGVTLTLSGGGLRSLASLGVISYLRNKQIKINEISGTSGGAIVALLIAFGLKEMEIKEFYLTIKKTDIFRPTLFSLCSLNKLENKLKLLLNDKDIKIPLTICITNLKTGEPKYISSKDYSKEDLIIATIASSSLLPFFKPVKFHGEYYIDGGYSDNLPNFVFKEQQKEGIKNISVNVNNVSDNLSFSPMKLIKRVLLIIMNSNIRYSKQNTDIFVNVDTLHDMNLFDFKKYDYAFEQGFKAASKYINL